MPVPFPGTIVRSKVLKNAQAMEEEEGVPRSIAVARAFREARAAYFKQFPGGALPAWMAFQGARLRKNYLDSGAPIPRALMENPIPKASVQKARELYSSFTGHEPDEGVEIKLSGAPFRVGMIVGMCLGLELDYQGKTYRLNWTGKDRPVVVVSSNGRQAVLVDGDMKPLAAFDSPPRVSRIMYETVRDGQRERYQHPFRPKSRPLFVSLDGRSACMRGGAFKFTERGFVDQR